MDFTDSNQKWAQIEERVIFRNKYVGLRNDLVQRPDGQNVEFVVVENRSYVTIVCEDEDGNMIMVKQFRYPWKEFSWEVPSGLIDNGETPEECARREVLEETGYEVVKMSSLLNFHPTGLGPGLCYIFHATVRKKTNQHLDANEFIEVGVFKPEVVERMVKLNDIVHASTLLGWAYKTRM